MFARAFSHNPGRVYATIGKGVFGSMMAANMVSTLASDDKRSLMTDYPFMSTGIIFVKSVGTGLLWPALAVSFAYKPLDTLRYTTTSFNTFEYLKNGDIKGAIAKIADELCLEQIISGKISKIENGQVHHITFKGIKKNGKIETSYAEKNGVVIPNAVLCFGKNGSVVDVKSEK